MDGQPAGSRSEMHRSGVDSARAFRLMRSGLFVWLAIAVVFGLGALAMPRVYESVAILEVSHGSENASAPTVSDRVEREIRAVVDQPRVVADLAGRLGPHPSKDAVASAGESIRIRARSARTFEIAYRASDPELARSGCRALLDAVLEAFPEHPAGDTKSENPRAILERRTKELTDFVVQHPDAVVQRPAQAAAPQVTPPDPGGSILRQEKARVEAAIAAAEQNAKAPISRDNPYEDVPPAPDIGALKRRLSEIRTAIAARERAMAASAPSLPDHSIEDKWRELVRAVADAQRAAFSEPVSPPVRLVARVVEPASVPSTPVESWRGPVAFVGVVLGLVAGTLFAFFRALGDWRESRGSDRPRAASDPAPIAISGTADAPTEQPPTVVVKSANPSSPVRPRSSPPPLPPSERQQLATDVTIPRPPPVPSFGPGQTQIGIVDPALFSRSGSAAPTGVRVEPRPIVSVIGERRSVPPARSSSNPPRPAAKRVSSNPPAGAAKVSSKPPRPAPDRSSPLPAPPDAGGSVRTARPAGADVERRTTSLPPRPESGNPASPAPPRPSTGRPRMDSPPLVRPSTSPRVATPIGMPRPSVPIQDESPPTTRRLGSPGDLVARGAGSAPSKGKTLAVYRPDTSYSFVDSEASRRRSERTASPSPLPERPGLTQPGFRRPSPPGLVSDVERQSRRPDSREDEIVAPRSAPPTWRLGPAITEDDDRGQLSALCDQVLSLARQRCFVVGVTSERSLNGAKSRVAARLAAMLASDGRARVLLLEADFDYPAVQRLMAIDMPHASGFSQQMRTRIKTGQHHPWVVVRCSPSLHVLGEGVVRSPGILFSQEFSEAIAELRRCYDVIVADGPVTGIGAEHRPLDAASDGVVFVIPKDAPLGEGLDRASKWFNRKELMAAVPAEIPAAS